MYKDQGECCPGNSAIAAREPVAQEVLKAAVRLAERADNLAARMEVKLAAVTTSQRPNGTCAGPEVCREYPPLFSELNNRFQTISAAMDHMEDILSRTEL